MDKLCPLPHSFILQKYRKKMKFLDQFVPFSRKCLKGKRKRMKMLVIPGVSNDFLMIRLLIIVLINNITEFSRHRGSIRMS